MHRPLEPTAAALHVISTMLTIRPPQYISTVNIHFNHVTVHFSHDHRLYSRDHWLFHLLPNPANFLSASVSLFTVRYLRADVAISHIGKGVGDGWNFDMIRIKTGPVDFSQSVNYPDMFKIQIGIFLLTKTIKISPQWVDDPQQHLEVATTAVVATKKKPYEQQEHSVSPACALESNTQPSHS